MANPQSTVQPFQQQAANQINQNYNGLADSLRQQFLSTGGGSSGKYGMALAQANLQRAGQLAGNDTSFQQTAASLPLEASQIAQALLGMNFGQTSQTSASGNQQQTGASNTSSSSFHI
ncbi:MAG TPA: hypothetical protein VKX49_26155 [Bryobacteraceae bacterium]|nr:hypothetical protein [Bryobacteraceae bacterium]